MRPRSTVSRVLCGMSLVILSGCFGKAVSLPVSDSAVGGKPSDGGGGASEAAAPSDVADVKIVLDGTSSNGGVGGSSSVDGGSGGAGGGVAGAGAGGSANGGAGVDSASGGSTNGGNIADASASGGSAGGGVASGGTSAGGSGPDAALDVALDGPRDTSALLPLGAACSAGTDCAAGSCAANAAGTGKICCASACSNACQACTSDGSACTTKNAGVADPACGTSTSCHTGACASGGTCQLASPGTNCGGILYCTSAGQCSCQAGVPCTLTNVCQVGTTSCTSGTSQCVASGNQPTTVACGAPQSCLGTTKNLAQACNGSGACGTQVTQPCLYRCNAQGTDCDNTNDCVPNPCANGGTCTNTNTTTGYTCACTGGWGGATCTVNLFQGLGTLPPQWGDASYANAVSADGTIVVGEADGGGGEVSVAFKWTSATGMTALAPSPSAPDTLATAISASGIVGRGLLIPAAILWTGSLEYDLNNQDINGSTASGISNNGTIVGVAIDSQNSPYRAVYWINSYAVPATLDTSGTYPYSNANGISLDGSTIVGNTSSGAFKWTSSSGMVILAGGTSTTANAASANGAVIVGSLNPISGAPVLWNGSTHTSLGAGPGEAFAVNSDGSVVVGTTAGNAFIWDSSNGQRLLATVLTTAGADLTGWNLNQGKGIASNGKVIVGWGSHNGNDEGWIARLP